jgi:hypothetical protein
VTNFSPTALLAGGETLPHGPLSQPVPTSTPFLALPLDKYLFLWLDCRLDCIIQYLDPVLYWRGRSTLQMLDATDVRGHDAVRLLLAQMLDLAVSELE